MQINWTYVRVAGYFFLPLLGTGPGVTVDMNAGTVLIDLDAALAGIAAAGGVSAWIFGKWGKK